MDDASLHSSVLIMVSEMMLTAVTFVLCLKLDERTCFLNLWLRSCSYDGALIQTRLQSHLRLCSHRRNAVCLVLKVIA
jgi:hypothetical protein